VQEPDLLELFVRPLHDAGIRYLVSGSLGSMLYSEPRLTIDIDLAVALADSDSPAIARLYPQPDFYTPPEEVISAENARECRAHFNVIHIPSGLKADFYPSQRDDFFQWAWRNRKSVAYPHGEILFAPAEYIILWKVAYYEEGGGEKHIRDIRRMIELSPDDIDGSLLAAELERRHLLETYRNMTAE
jgi:hypothetical protein